MDFDKKEGSLCLKTTYYKTLWGRSRWQVGSDGTATDLTSVVEEAGAPGENHHEERVK